MVADDGDGVTEFEIWHRSDVDGGDVHADSTDDRTEVMTNFEKTAVGEAAIDAFEVA